MVDETRSALRSQARQGTERTAGALDNLSAQFRALASGDREGAGELGRYADQASERLRAVAQRIGSRGFDGLVDDVQSFARRRPGLFLAAAAASGFAAGRLFRGAQAASSSPSPASGDGGWPQAEAGPMRPSRRASPPRSWPGPRPHDAGTGPYTEVRRLPPGAVPPLGETGSGR